MTLDAHARTLFQGEGLVIRRQQCLRDPLARCSEELQREHLMIFSLSGVNVMRTGDATHLVDPSHVVVSRAEDVYSVSHPHGSGEISLHIAIEDSALAHGGALAPAQIERTPEMHLELLRLQSECEHGAEHEAIAERAWGLVDDVLSADGTRDDRPGLTDLALEAAALLAARFAEPLSLDVIADALGTTRFTLSREFKRATGETVWGRVQQLRIRRAASEIHDGADDLTELAFSLGFSSHSHFTRTFRQVAGTTPSAFRRRLLS